MNENQENNLQNSVGSPTPVEPVTTPVEPTPVDSAPVSSAPVETPTPVETPAPAMESTPVQPVQPVVEPAPNVAPAPEVKKKGMNPIILILLILAVIGGVVYGLYTYTDILPVGKKASSNDTTTTTTVTLESTLAYKSFNDFITAAKTECEKDKYCGEHLLINTDTTFVKIKEDMDNKCKADGDSVSFELNGNTVEYTCKKDDSEAALNDSTTTYWYSEVTINKTFKYNYGTYTTSIPGELHTNGKNYISLDNSQGVDVDHLYILDSTGKELYKNFNYVTNIKFDSTSKEYEDIAGLTKNNVLYFVDTVNEPSVDVKNTCTLKYIDFFKSDVKVESTGFTSDCYVE